MDRENWKNIIKQATLDAGTYRPFFDSIIDTLAGIMEKRDDAEMQYERTGAQTVVMHTNRAGQANIVKNPALVVVDDLNKTALAYWRDLGLTPAGLKRINEQALQKTKGGGFDEVLKGLIG